MVWSAIYTNGAQRWSSIFRQNRSLTFGIGVAFTKSVGLFNFFRGSESRFRFCTSVSNTFSRTTVFFWDLRWFAIIKDDEHGAWGGGGILEDNLGKLYHQSRKTFTVFSLPAYIVFFSHLRPCSSDLIFDNFCRKQGYRKFRQIAHRQTTKCNNDQVHKSNDILKKRNNLTFQKHLTFGWCVFSLNFRHPCPLWSSQQFHIKNWQKFSFLGNIQI